MQYFVTLREESNVSVFESGYWQEYLYEQDWSEQSVEKLGNE